MWRIYHLQIISWTPACTQLRGILLVSPQNLPDATYYFFLSPWAGGILQILQSDWFRERAVFSPSGPLTAGGSYRNHLLGLRKIKILFTSQGRSVLGKTVPYEAGIQVLGHIFSQFSPPSLAVSKKSILIVPSLYSVGVDWPSPPPLYPLKTMMYDVLLPQNPPNSPPSNHSR